MELISNEEDLLNLDLIRLQGKGKTEIIETKNTLRLIYERKEGDLSNGTLVDSFPNEVPLYRDRNIYLGCGEFASILRLGFFSGGNS